MTNRQLRVALHARVSTSDQCCEIQLDSMRRWARAFGHKVVGEYIDHGVSGAKRSRPELNRIFVAAEQGLIDAVVTTKIDRFARSVKNLLDYIELLKSHKAAYIAIESNIDTRESNPYAQLQLTLLGAIAEFERAMILERTQAGRMKKMTDETPDSWQLPMPFEIVEGFPKIVPSQLDIVNQIYSWRELGNSIHKIHDFCVEQNILGRRSGKPLAHSTIHDLLTSKCMITEYWRGPKGHQKLYPIKDRDGNLLRVMSDERYFNVQRMIEAIATSQTGRPSEDLLLRGWVYCSKCGGRCVGSRCGRGRVLRYRCTRNSNRKRDGVLYCAGGGYPRADALEPLVWREVWKLLTDPERLRRIALAYVAELDAQKANQRDPRELLKSKRAELGRVEDMYQKSKNPISFEEYESRREPILAEIETLEDEARVLGKIVEIAPLDRIAEVCARITGKKMPEIFEAQRMVLEVLLNLRVVVRGKDVEITGEVPVAEAAAAAPVKGSGRKNHPHRFTGTDDSFQPIPFVINARLAA